MKIHPIMRIIWSSLAMRKVWLLRRLRLMSPRRTFCVVSLEEPLTKKKRAIAHTIISNCQTVTMPAFNQIWTRCTTCRHFRSKTTKIWIWTILAWRVAANSKLMLLIPLVIKLISLIRIFWILTQWLTPWRAKSSTSNRCSSSSTKSATTRSKRYRNGRRLVFWKWICSVRDLYNFKNNFTKESKTSMRKSASKTRKKIRWRHSWLRRNLLISRVRRICFLKRR